MICNCCQNKVNAAGLRGACSWDKKTGRTPAWICMTCSEVCPCDTKGYYSDGDLICKHGYIYNVDYYWHDGIAKILLNFKKRKWWSFLFISNLKHNTLLINQHR